MVIPQTKGKMGQSLKYIIPQIPLLLLYDVIQRLVTHLGLFFPLCLFRDKTKEELGGNWTFCICQVLLQEAVLPCLPIKERCSLAHRARNQPLLHSSFQLFNFNFMYMYFVCMYSVPRACLLLVDQKRGFDLCCELPCGC